MAKYIHPDVHDKGLQEIVDNCDKQVALTAFTSTYATANGANKLAEVAVAPGDFTLANGDVSGRKVTVAQKTGGTITAEGNPTNIAWLDTVNSRVLMVTEETTTQTLYVGNPVTFPSVSYESRDPA